MAKNHTFILLGGFIFLLEKNPILFLTLVSANHWPELCHVATVLQGNLQIWFFFLKIASGHSLKTVVLGPHANTAAKGPRSQPVWPRLSILKESSHGGAITEMNLCRKHECWQCDAPQVTALCESPVCLLCAPGVESKWKDQHEGWGLWMLLYCVADRVWVLQLGVRPEPLRWESQVQDTGPPETSQPQEISIGKSSPRDLRLNTKTQLHSMTSKLQCWTPHTKQLARQEYNPTRLQRGCLKS